jgi:hypothetical protein
VKPDQLGHGRRSRPVRRGHTHPSRWCYSQGCGHPDCYRADADYRWQRLYGEPAPFPVFGVTVVAEGAIS